MPVVLVAAIGLSFLLTGATIYGMQRGQQDWLTPLINALAHPHGSFLRRTALRVASVVVAAAAWVVREVVHAMSLAASHAMGGIAHWIDGLGGWVTHVVTTVGQLAEDTAYGFERLVTHTIPREIHSATRPLWRGIDHLERDFHHLRERLRAFERGIDRLIAHRILPAIRAAEHAIAVTIPRELGRIRARERAAERAIRHPSRAWIKGIWRAGWVLVGAGLMVRFLTRRFPYLFCRNSTNALKAVCGMDTSLLTALLAGTVALNEVNLRDFCRTLQAVEGEIVREIHGFVTLDD